MTRIIMLTSRTLVPCKIMLSWMHRSTHSRLPTCRRSGDHMWSAPHQSADCALQWNRPHRPQQMLHHLRWLPEMRHTAADWRLPIHLLNNAGGWEFCLTRAARPAGFAATAPNATPSREYSCTVPLLPHIKTMSPTCQQKIAGDHPLYSMQVCMVTSTSPAAVPLLKTQMLRGANPRRSCLHRVLVVRTKASVPLPPHAASLCAGFASLQCHWEQLCG
jgi:hypothetical protein